VYLYGLIASRANHPLIGPFFYRLYRCSDSDVTQIKTFIDWRASQNSGSTPTSTFSLGLGVNIGASELYSPNVSTELNYTQVLMFGKRVIVGNDYTMAHARYETNAKLYTYNATNKQYAKPTYPVYLLTGTLDPQTPNGYAHWFANGLGSSAKVIDIPFEVHGVFNYENTCVQAIVLQILNTWGKGPLDTACLAFQRPPDFDGSDANTQQLSVTAFGVADLWNIGGARDAPATTCTAASCPSCSSSDDEDWPSSAVAIVAVFATLFGFTLAFLSWWMITRRTCMTSTILGSSSSSSMYPATADSKKQLSEVKVNPMSR
jgi:hypothetical protein